MGATRSMRPRSRPPGPAFFCVLLVVTPTLALAQATPLTSDVLGSTESFTSTTADNAGLTQLMQLNVMGPACYGGKCTIPRAINAPWFDNGSPKKVGSVVSATIPGGMAVIAGDSQPMRTPLV